MDLIKACAKFSVFTRGDQAYVFQKIWLHPALSSGVFCFVVSSTQRPENVCKTILNKLYDMRQQIAMLICSCLINLNEIRLARGCAVSFCIGFSVFKVKLHFVCKMKLRFVYNVKLYFGCTVKLQFVFRIHNWTAFSR